MHKFFVLGMVLFLSAACRHHPDTLPVHPQAGPHRLRFNPPDSSTYRYHTTSESFLSIMAGGKTFIVHRTSRFTVSYLVSRDSNDIMLDMSFDSIDYHENSGFGSRRVEISDQPGPARDLLNRIRAGIIFLRVHPSDLTVTLGGAQEIVNGAIDSYYAEPDRNEAKKYWGQWVEQAFVWKNVDPLTAVSLDSARHTGDYWADQSTNAEDIYFKMDKRFHFDGIHRGMAEFRSLGLIDKDSARTALGDAAVAGVIAGKETARYLIDTATGMPGEVQDTVRAEGAVRVGNRQGRILIVKTISMLGGKSK